MTDTFATPDDGGALKSSDFSTGYLEQEGNRATQSFLDNPLPQLVRQARLAHAGGEDAAVGAGGDVDVFSGTSPEEQQAVIDRQKAAIPDISKDDAKTLLKQQGISESEVPLGDADSHKLPVLQMRIDDAQAKRDRDAAIERGPQGFFPGALGLVTSLGVGMLDPINDAAFSIPVIGEARMGKILAAGGDSILARAAIRSGEGAVKGAAGTAALTPLDWWFHTRDGQDYTMAEAMHSIVMGAGMGAAFHALPGAYRDWRTRRQGLPLEGTALDRVLREMPQQPAEPEAVVGAPTAAGAEEDVPGISTPAEIPAPSNEGEDINMAIPEGLPTHPGEVIADLPPAARQDAVHAAMAGLIHGEPVQAAEMLNIAADHDPRIAETMDPWNAAGEAARASNGSSDGGRSSLRLVRDDHLPNTGDTVSYSINGADGSNVGFAEFIIDGDTARILDISSFAFNGDRSRYGDVRNSIGARQMRDLLDQFREQHPEVKKFTADRVSGARKGGSYDAGLKGNEIEVKLPKPRGRAAADPKTWSLFEYFASKGGLKPDPELEAIFGNKKGPMIGGFGPLIRRDGMPLDEALRSAEDGHYLFDKADIDGGEASLTPRDLLDSIDRQNRGQRVYRMDHVTPDRQIAPEEETKHIVDALHDELEAASGQKGIEIDPKLEARVVEIIRHEGEHDVLAAYERAIMEDEEHYEATAKARSQSENPADRSIPGWDVHDDARPASRGGAEVEAGGGSAGRPGPADGRGAGEPARHPRPGDRASGPAQLKSSAAQAAADPRWRDLANVKPDYDDPDVLAESEAAAKLPEPDSVQDPQKSLSALEKAASDAEEVWRVLEPTLTENERALVNDVMDRLKLDAETRAKVISEGAICLAGAFA